MKLFANLPCFSSHVFLVLILLTALILPLGCSPSEKPDKNNEAVNSAEKNNVTNLSNESNKQASPEGETDTNRNPEVTADESEQTETSNSQKPYSNDKTVIATVNGNPIYEYELKGTNIDQLTLNEILYIEGLNRGLDKKFEDQINDYKKRIITSEIRKEFLDKLTNTEVTDEDYKKYYKNNEGNYMHLTVKQISVKDKDASEEMRKKVEEGEDFQDIAEYFEDKGITVFVNESILRTSSNHVFDKKEIGSLSKTRKGVQGYEIMKITQIHRMPLEKAKPAIKYNIQSQRKAEALKKYAEKIKDENNIAINIIKDNKK